MRILGVYVSYETIMLALIVVFVLSLIAQGKVKRVFNRYNSVPGARNIPAYQAAQEMLLDNGSGVTVQPVQGTLTDHYDPRTKVVNLSEGVYGSASIAACAVAAHETGHAIQHATGYAPLRLRSALVPVVTFANNTVQWVLLAGVILIDIFPSLIWAGIALFAVTTFFSLVTLPVEINASQRAVTWLEGAGVVDAGTRPMAVDALKWAAYTYIIAALGSLATLFYYISLANSRR